MRLSIEIILVSAVFFGIMLIFLDIVKKELLKTEGESPTPRAEFKSIITCIKNVYQLDTKEK